MARSHFSKDTPTHVGNAAAMQQSRPLTRKSRIAALSLTQKVALTFGFLLVDFLILTVVATLRLHSLSDAMVATVHAGNAREQAINAMASSANQFGTVIRNLAVGDAEHFDVQLHRLVGAYERYQSATREAQILLSGSREGQRLLGAATARGQSMQAILSAAQSDVGARGDAAIGFQVRVLLREGLRLWNDRQDAWLQSIEAIGRWSDGVAQDDASRFAAESKSVQLILISGAIAAIGVGSMFAAWLIRDVTRGLSMAVSAAQAMSRQDLSTPIKTNRLDDIGFVLQGMESMRVALHAELSRRDREAETNKALKSAMVDYTISAIVSTDAEGCVVEINPAAEQMFMLPRELAVGRRFAALLLAPHDRQRFEDEVRKLELQGQVTRGVRLQLDALRKGKDAFPIEMALWRMVVDHRAYVSTSMIDLTERQRAAEEIDRQREALRQSEKLTSMGGILASVAHELNNPLAIVLGRSLLLEEKCTDVAILRDVRLVHDAAERCSRIVRTFLAMARGKPVARVPLDMRAVIKSSVELLSYNLRTHGVQLKQDIPDELPQPDGDPDQLTQVIVNLLVNAQQALQGQVGTREITLEAKVEVQEGRRTILVRVTDNGPGVPPDEQPRIFEPFFTTKREGIGTGLGLPVSRSIARAHGGDLTLEPAQNVTGATFLLSLPLGNQPLAAAPDTVQKASKMLLHCRMLVVDDEVELATIIKEMLETVGYEVEVAFSGSTALQRLRQQRFDGIVSDFRMTDTDGAQFWRAVRDVDGDLACRILFVTGDALSQDSTEFFRTSGCPHLEKPFTAQELVARVNDLLSSTAA